MKTIVIGDTHFKDKYPGYLDAQIECVQGIINCECIDSSARFTQLIFLGDFFDSRKPSAVELLKVQALLKWCTELMTRVIILVGNHETFNKSDDGVSVTQLFEGEKISVISQAGNSYIRHYIPYYEDEQRIIDYVKERVQGNGVVVGHFGLMGLIDTYNDYDFTISSDILPKLTILGHIHGNADIHLVHDRRVVVVGTPYHTSFQECDKKNYYAVWDSDSYDITCKEIPFGVRHKIVEFADLAKEKANLEDSNYFTALRVLVTIKDKITVDEVQKIMSTYKVGHIELKYKPILDSKTIDYKPANIISSINDHLLEDYLNSITLPFPKKDLLDVLKVINDN